MSGLFSSGSPPTQTVGQWKGIKPVQQGLTGVAAGQIPGLGTGLSTSQNLWENYMSPEFLNPMSDPNMQPALQSILFPAQQYFAGQMQGLNDQAVASGNAISSDRMKNITEMAGGQAGQLENALSQFIMPLIQQRQGLQFEASQMPMSLMQMFTQLAGAGSGTTVVGQPSPSLFSQLLGLGTAAGGLGWNPFSGGGDNAPLGWDYGTPVEFQG